jgi:hypothetical protein
MAGQAVMEANFLPFFVWRDGVLRALERIGVDSLLDLWWQCKEGTGCLWRNGSSP